MLNSTSTGAICFSTSNKSSKPSTKIITHLLWKPGNGAPAMFRDDCVTAFASAVRLAPILLLGVDVDRENERGGRSRPSSRRFVQRRCRRKRMRCGKREINPGAGRS